MKRRDFVRHLTGTCAIAAGFGLAGCDDMLEPRSYGPYDYFYYRDVGVYFHISTATYYFIQEGVWVRSRNPPPHYYLDPYQRVVIVIQTAVPYLHHAEHRRRYPQLVRQTNRYEDRHWDRHDHHDRPSRRPSEPREPRPPAQEGYVPERGVPHPSANTETTEEKPPRKWTKDEDEDAPYVPERGVPHP